MESGQLVSDLWRRYCWNGTKVTREEAIEALNRFTKDFDTTPISLIKARYLRDAGNLLNAVENNTDYFTSRNQDTLPAIF